MAGTGWSPARVESGAVVRQGADPLAQCLWILIMLYIFYALAIVRQL